MYIRYQSPTPGKRGVHAGVFGLANTLARSGRLSDDEWAAWRAGNDWFDAAYPDPSKTDASVYDPKVNPRATAWFKDSATHLLERVAPYLALLARHGIPCERVESEDPGRVIYEDDVQIVIVPRWRGQDGGMTREPGTPLTRSAASLVVAADARVASVSVDELKALLDDEGTCIVDIRDPRELEREGMVPGATSAPRGMLEFWVDPESPYYKPKLDDGRRLVLYCGSGWRSALAAATLLDMGRDDVAHLAGGFKAWQSAGMPVESREPRG